MKGRREIEEAKQVMQDSLAQLDAAVSLVKRLQGEAPVAAAMQ